VILAAGLSPAWQQILTLDDLHVGQVNRASEAVWCASGKVVNVAMAVHTLEQSVTLISSSGGLSGRIIEQEVESVGMNAEWIPTNEATRVCTTLLTKRGVTTEIAENTADVSDDVVAAFVNKTRIFANVADIVVFSGSLPANAPPETFAQIMRNVPKRFLLDIRGPALQYCLPIGPFLVKPNREELEFTLGEDLSNEQDLIQAMCRLNDGGATWVVVSDGEKGVWVTGENQAWHLMQPKIQTINPIGCGDSLTAGIACGLLEKRDVLQAVQYGVGAAAHNAEILLPARLNARRVYELAQQVEVRDLSA
jgi:tagatose 6-phosphate kinase